MTNQEILDSLDEDKKAIALNILKNENGGLGVHDVNSLPDSTFKRVMSQTDAIADGGKVSYP